MIRGEEVNSAEVYQEYTNEDFFVVAMYLEAICPEQIVSKPDTHFGHQLLFCITQVDKGQILP